MNKLDVITEKFKNDNYAKNYGIILDDLKENTIKMHMQLKPDMNNFNGRRISHCKVHLVGIEQLFQKH